jgi:hypothetical protein
MILNERDGRTLALPHTKRRQCTDRRASIDHVETLPENQSSEQSLTRLRVCRRVSLDGKRCVRLNQRGIGEYTTTLAESRNLSR